MSFSERGIQRGGKFFGSLAVALAVGLVVAPSVRADALRGYQLFEQFNLPAGAGPMDALRDGRLLVLVGAEVRIETARGSRTFVVAGTLPSADIPSFGASFLAISPDQARIAVGNNGGTTFDNYQTGVFDFPALSGSWFAANHLDGEWLDNSLLALTAGEFGSPSVVRVLDTQSPDPMNPVNTTIIENIGGASAGIAIDAMGTLFTGNGFQTSGPSGTGVVKAFALSAWSSALSGGVPLDFESSGTLVVEVLSASPLRFDHEGNLLVGGGGDSSIMDDMDFVAVVAKDALAAALAGSGPVDVSNPAFVRRLDPDPLNDFNFFGVISNPASYAVHVRNSGSDTVYTYLDTMSVPAVSAWGLLALALGVVTAATLLLRRFRPAPSRSTTHRG